MASPALVPDPASLHLLSLEAKGQVILMEVITRAPEACCPLCQRAASDGSAGFPQQGRCSLDIYAPRQSGLRFVQREF